MSKGERVAISVRLEPLMSWIVLKRSGGDVPAGHKFFQAANGAWLTATVPPAFLSE